MSESLSAGQVSMAVRPDTSQFGAKLKSGITSGTAGVGEKMGALIKGGLMKFAGPIAAVTAAFGVKHLVDESTKAFEDYASEVKKVQRITGGTAEQASGLTGAFKLMGMTLGSGGDGSQSVNGAIIAFSRNLGRMSADSGKAAALNKIFGQSIKDAHGNVKPMAELLPGLADTFKSMPDGAQKTALATQLFGRAGASMLPFLNKGSAGIAELTDKAKKMGLVLDDTAINIMTESKKSAREFNATIQGLKITLGEDLVPVLDSVQNLFRNYLAPILEKVTSFLQAHREDFLKFAESIANIGKSASGFTDFIQNIANSIQGFITGGGLQRMLQHFMEFRTKLIDSLAKALPGIISALANAIVTAIPALVNTLVSMIPTLLQTAQDVFKALMIALNTVIPQLIKAIVDMLPKITNTLVAMLPGLIQSALDLFMGLVTGLIQAIPILINAVLDALPKILQTLVNMIPALIDGALKLFLGLVDGLVKAIPMLINVLVNQVLPKLIQTLITMLPILINGAIKLFLGLVQGLTKAIPAITRAVVKLIPVIVSALMNAMPQIISAGIQITVGLAKGIIENAPTIIGTVISSLGDLLVSQFKAYFGIKSPSKLFHGFGGHITQGLANGLMEGRDTVAGAVGELNDSVSAGFNSKSLSANVKAHGKMTVDHVSNMGGGRQPIMADGIGLIGFVEHVAGKQAKLVFNSELGKLSRGAR